MGGQPDGHGGQPRRNKGREARPFAQGQDKRQGTGPESRHHGHGPRIKDRQFPGRLDIRHVHDQGVKLRPALCRKDFRHRKIIARIARKPVNRFGRDRDQTAGSQDPGSLGKPLLSWCKFECLVWHVTQRRA